VAFPTIALKQCCSEGATEAEFRAECCSEGAAEAPASGEDSSSQYWGLESQHTQTRKQRGRQTGKGKPLVFLTS